MPICVFEPLTRLTAGKVFESLPFSTTKAIVERGKLGGESTSLKSIQKGYEAYFKKSTPEQLKDQYQKASDKFEKSDTEYQQLKADPNTDPKKLQEAKNQRDSDLVDAIGNTVYQYIAGNSFHEAGEVFIHRSTSLEREMGSFDREGRIR